MQLLVLDAPAMDEVLILPDAVDHDVTREALHEGARLPIGRVARIDVGMHDAGAPDEPARRAEIIRDAGEHAAQTPHAMLNRELPEPQRRGRGDATRARAAAGHLQVQSIDVIEHEPAIHFGNAIVFAALDAVGVHHADARSMSQATLRAHDVEDRVIGTARGCELLIDGRQEPDVGSVGVAGQLDGRDRLHYSPGIDQVLRHLKQLAALEEERAFLGKEERLARIERELTGVRFDLREIGLDRAVQVEIVGDAPPHVPADLRIPRVVGVAGRGWGTGGLAGRFGIDVDDQATVHPREADQISRLPDERRVCPARREPRILKTRVLDLAHDVEAPVLRLLRPVAETLERYAHLDFVTPRRDAPARLKDVVRTEVRLLPSNDRTT